MSLNRKLLLGVNFIGDKDNKITDRGMTKMGICVALKLFNIIKEINER